MTLHGRDRHQADGDRPFRLIVGISGASGIVYGIRLLEVLRSVAWVETYLLLTPAARRTLRFESDREPAEVEALADHTFKIGDIAAPISSGSYPIDAMIVVPCSMGTLSSIASSASENLLERAADVTLKERRPLILVPREAPLHLGHLRRMVEVTEMGAIICPPMPAFYNRPSTIGDVVDHTVSRLLDLLGIDPGRELTRRWAGSAQEGRRSPDAAGAEGDEPEGR